MEIESTTISLSKGVRNRLRTFGDKGETYDTILDRIMNNSEEFTTSNVPQSGTVYCTEDEVADMVHDFEDFKEYAYGCPGVMPDCDMYNREFVITYCNR